MSLRAVLSSSAAAVVLAASGCGGSTTRVPSDHGRPLDEALRRLGAAGLRATYPAGRTPCGMGLPQVDVQSPRAPAEVGRGTVVAIRFGPTPIPSPAVPLHHARFTTVPRLVGLDAEAALGRLHAIWPCVHVRPASRTEARTLEVVAQRPGPGARVPAYGVRVGRRGCRPTTVDLTIAAR